MEQNNISSSSFANVFNQSLLDTSTTISEIVNNDNGNASSSILLDEPPVEAWCFDLLLFYRTIGEDDPQARKVLAELEGYAKFSFVINGLVTCLLAIFGLMGNALFLAQLHGKKTHFSKRLASHLSALCVWDIALLLCCLCSYGIICVFFGILPFVGVTAYLLYFFQPFASFCVTGTIWQVLAITVERYKAIHRPLEQRTRKKGLFSLKLICAAIVLGAFALNFSSVPFERSLVDCYEFRSDGFMVRTMIVQQELVNNQYYAILSHLVPDLLFRAPTPIIVIAILTVRTLQIASAQRTIGHQQIVPQRQRALGRNVHLMLTLLSVKFVLCNTLYLFNTILLEILGYGGKTSSQQTELEMEQYITSNYLTDFSNMLLAIHSATNWLIFYKWPKCTKEEKKRRFAASFTLSVSSSNNNESSRNMPPIDANGAKLALKRFQASREDICAAILASLCSDSASIRKALGLTKSDDTCGQSVSECQRIFLEEPTQRRHTTLLGDVIEAVFSPLTKTMTSSYDSGDSMLEWRQFCREIGYHYHRVNTFMNADQWKSVRTQLVLALTACSPPSKHQQQQNSSVVLQQNSSYNNSLPNRCQLHQIKLNQTTTLSSMQRSLIRTFNCALREMKNGSVCGFVDTSQRQMTARGGGGHRVLGAITMPPQHLIKRLSWLHGPPGGVVARAIFPRQPSSSREDSFSLVFTPTETESSHYQKQQKQNGAAPSFEETAIECSALLGDGKGDNNFQEAESVRRSVTMKKL